MRAQVKAERDNALQERDAATAKCGALRGKMELARKALE
jgi:hypothetical protein